MILSKDVSNNIDTCLKSLSQTVDCPAGEGSGGDNTGMRVEEGYEKQKTSP